MGGSPLPGMEFRGNKSTKSLRDCSLPISARGGPGAAAGGVGRAERGSPPRSLEAIPQGLGAVVARQFIGGRRRRAAEGISPRPFALMAPRYPEWNSGATKAQSPSGTAAFPSPRGRGPGAAAGGVGCAEGGSPPRSLEAVPQGLGAVVARQFIGGQRRRAAEGISPRPFAWMAPRYPEWNSGATKAQSPSGTAASASPRGRGSGAAADGGGRAGVGLALQWRAAVPQGLGAVVARQFIGGRRRNSLRRNLPRGTFDGAAPQVVRCTSVALAWSVGLMMTSSMQTCGGRVATHTIVSAMSSAVSAVIPR